ncbi:integral membrane protein GPR137C isoform X2 [Pangasianodon hypophthalmus]|uniref:integral membrane protein GPR137C isoform X2 n=1 Tax=Pangasianodon hypophthalmus TaxID=310915 RepID=UPI000EFE0678|nr:integral membrane protein GPR137C isoform X2 [Pangasianodon hypophthalmus]
MLSLENQLRRLGALTAEDEGEDDDDEGAVLDLALTAVHTLLYSLLFFFIYSQLWLILHYGHKRLSYRSVFLFLCLLWSALRTTLFSFYFNNMAQASQLQPLPFWLFYCFPVCLQFCTLCLLNLYFAQIMCKAKAKYSPELSKYNVFFLVVNVTCSLMVLTQKNMEASNAKHIVLARVLINDSLFVLCAISLATCICKLAKMSSANVYLESKGTSVCQATATGAAVVLLYTSRACYNLAVVAVSPKDRATPFSYGWYSFSDQADVEKISGKAYMVFGIVLFFWEFVPTTLLVVFFRVQRPNQNLAPGGMIHSHSFNSRAYFFDNPRRYDSDDDLSRSVSSRGERGSSTMSSTSQLGASWYGSIQKTGSFTFSAPHTSTAPLLLSYGSIQTSQHHNYYSTPQDYCSTPQTHYITPQN